jgi:hypothetical protein
MMKLKTFFSNRSLGESNNAAENVEISLNAGALLPLHAQETLSYGDPGHGSFQGGMHGSISSNSLSDEKGDSQPMEIKPNGYTDITSMDTGDDDEAHQSPRSQVDIARVVAEETGEMIDEDGSSLSYPPPLPSKRRRRILLSVCLAFIVTAILIGAIAGTLNKSRNNGFTDTEGNAIVINPDNPNEWPPTPSPVPNDDDLNVPPAEPIDSTNHCPLNLEMKGIIIADLNQSVVLIGQTENTTGVGVNNNPNATDPIHTLPLCQKDDGASFPYGRGLWYAVKGPGAVVRATTCNAPGLLSEDQTVSSLQGLDTQVSATTMTHPVAHKVLLPGTPKRTGCTTFM